MERAVHDAVLVVWMWVVLNQWLIGELIEGERGKPTRKRRREAQHSSGYSPCPWWIIRGGWKLAEGAIYMDKERISEYPGGG